MNCDKCIALEARLASLEGRVAVLDKSICKTVTRKAHKALTVTVTDLNLKIIELEKGPAAKSTKINKKNRNIVLRYWFRECFESTIELLIAMGVSKSILDKHTTTAKLALSTAQSSGKKVDPKSKMASIINTLYSEIDTHIKVSIGIISNKMYDHYENTDLPLIKYIEYVGSVDDILKSIDYSKPGKAEELILPEIKSKSKSSSNSKSKSKKEVLNLDDSDSSSGSSD